MMMQVDEAKNSAGSNRAVVAEAADQVVQDVDMVEEGKQGEQVKVSETEKAETMGEKQAHVV